MKALQLIATGKPGTFRIVEVPSPQPEPDEVLVAVEFCGLNHLDLWMEEGALPIPQSLPRIPGGEIAGSIAEVGTQVTDWKPEDKVAVQSNLFCGQCEFCAQGEESLCLNGTLLGVQRDGGFAERVCVPARALVQLPNGVAARDSAALTLAGSTALRMLTRRAEVKRGDWVLVMAGASGVGSAAIQIARTLGARVISTGSSEAKRALASSLGAEHVLDPALPDWPKAVRQITGKHGVDLVIEHIGGKVLEKCFECLARGGTIVTCGATAGSEITMNLWPFFVKQQRLIGSYGRNRADIQATLEWIAAGNLKSVIDETFPLEQTPMAFAKLRSRTALGKIMVQAVT